MKKKLHVKIDGYWRPVEKIVLDDFSFTDGAFPITDFKYESEEVNKTATDTPEQPTQEIEPLRLWYEMRSRTFDTEQPNEFEIIEDKINELVNAFNSLKRKDV